MPRYIDADEFADFIKRWGQGSSLEDVIEWLQTGEAADVRKNVHAKKVIGGGERDGATCWFECSSCHGSVDIEDAYCKHCGAVLEYEP